MHLYDTYTKGALYGLWELPAIQKGEDLNNYKTPGMYSVRENVVAEEIDNLPLKTAGILKVTTATGSFEVTGNWVYLRQEYYPFSEFSKYGRMLTTGTTGVFKYGEWKKVY